MLGLVGEATQGIVAELHHLVAEFRSFIAHGIGAIAKLIGDAVNKGATAFATRSAASAMLADVRPPAPLTRCSSERRRRSIWRTLVDIAWEYSD